MASKDRERRLAREHLERQQARREEAAARRRRRAAQAAAVVSARVVVAARVAIALAVGGDDDDTAATADPSATPTASATDSAATPTAGAATCQPAPEPQPSPATFEAPGEPTGDTSTAVLATTCGDVTVELLGEQAPETVASFAFLAQQGFFDATPCHRLTTSGIFVLQCGDPTGTGTGGPGYTVPLENAPPDGRYPAGTLAMARSQDPDSGGSQFFLVHEDSELPAPGYTVFGRVTEGLEILQQVAAAGATPEGDGAPTQEIGLSTVTVGEAAS